MLGHLLVVATRASATLQDAHLFNAWQSQNMKYPEQLNLACCALKKG